MEYVDAVCLVLPTGDNLWFENKEGVLDSKFKDWQKRHPELVTSERTAGAIAIRMPKDKFLNIRSKK